MPRRYTLLYSMRFEWDDQKDRINQQKHDGLAFETDPFAVFRKDRSVEDEPRRHAIDLARAACSWLFLMVLSGNCTIVIEQDKTSQERGRGASIKWSRPSSLLGTYDSCAPLRIDGPFRFEPLFLDLSVPRGFTTDLHAACVSSL